MLNATPARSATCTMVALRFAGIGGRTYPNRPRAQNVTTRAAAGADFARRHDARGTIRHFHVTPMPPVAPRRSRTASGPRDGFELAIRQTEKRVAAGACLAADFDLTAFKSENVI